MSDLMNNKEPGFYAVTTVDFIPDILYWDGKKWIFPDGTMTEFTQTADILWVIPVNESVNELQKEVDELKEKVERFESMSLEDFCDYQHEKKFSDLYANARSVDAIFETYYGSFNPMEQ